MKCQNIKMKWIILFWIYVFCATEIEGGPLNQIDETGITFYFCLCLMIHYIKASYAGHPNVWNIQLCFIFGFKDTKEKS